MLHDLRQRHLILEARYQNYLVSILEEDDADKTASHHGRYCSGLPKRFDIYLSRAEWQ